MTFGFAVCDDTQRFPMRQLTVWGAMKIKLWDDAVRTDSKESALVRGKVQWELGKKYRQQI
ncbi:uncharacterized protein N7515_006396 [Penicillium bovifimosum]|uniref:Uncharacterized protein n=1 Tax=Penicillium bovifimosum TaxID=126998 RepID=A0A9W9GUP8_9EURO|nr:uncharacterized protein N7515_006396 [Penicillium bovifimosum]KAJ5130357.1 hypothetical protein N7515_006396 [Penicillium bovifimosum]